MSVAEFDDHPLAELWTPPITTAKQDFAELGQLGLGQLLATVDGRPIAEVSSVEPTLVIRARTAATKGGR